MPLVYFTNTTQVILLFGFHINTDLQPRTLLFKREHQILSNIWGCICESLSPKIWVKSSCITKYLYYKEKDIRPSFLLRHL